MFGLELRDLELDSFRETPQPACAAGCALDHKATGLGPGVYISADLFLHGSATRNGSVRGERKKSKTRENLMIRCFYEIMACGKLDSKVSLATAKEEAAWQLDEFREHMQ